MNRSTTIRILTAALILTLALLLTLGCGDDEKKEEQVCNCDDAIAVVERQYGEPEEVNRYNSDGYSNIDYWYWSQGIEFSFTWGSMVSECCNKSTYTFDPITANASPIEKEAARASKVLISTTREPRRGLILD